MNRVKVSCKRLFLVFFFLTNPVNLFGSSTVNPDRTELRSLYNAQCPGMSGVEHIFAGYCSFENFQECQILSETDFAGVNCSKPFSNAKSQFIPH